MDFYQLWTIISTPDNIPIVLLMIVVPFYTWYAMRQAFANDRLIAELEASPALAKTHHRKTQPWKPGWAREVHVWPYLLRIEFLAAIIVTLILMVWSITLNAPLEEPSNPTLTMNPAKAPWYFLGLQEMLVYFDPWIAGVVMPSLIIVGLMVIPYIDANPLGNGYYTFKQRKFSISTFIFGFIILWVTMIVIGTLIRGPGWMWFWPGTTWDHNRLEFAVNRDLPDVFSNLIGFKLGRIGKIIFGAIVSGIYFVVAGWFIHKLISGVGLTVGRWQVIKESAFNQKIFKRMSLLQYSVMQVFLIVMLSLPIKMIARLLFRIKYVWVTPWFNV